MHNQFFALAAIPSGPAPQVVVHPHLSSAAGNDRLDHASSAMLTNGTGKSPLSIPRPVLAPASDRDEQSFTFYAGPKEYNGLAKIGDRMDNNLDLIMGFSGFHFGFFSKVLLLSA